MPQKLRNIDPFFSRCTDAFFTGYDPPRTLVPATAMAPITTKFDPVATRKSAIPGMTQDPGPIQTTAAIPLSSIDANTSENKLDDANAPEGNLEDESTSTTFIEEKQPGNSFVLEPDSKGQNMKDPSGGAGKLDGADVEDRPSDQKSEDPPENKPVYNPSDVSAQQMAQIRHALGFQDSDELNPSRAEVPKDPSSPAELEQGRRKPSEGFAKQPTTSPFIDKISGDFQVNVPASVFSSPPATPEQGVPGNAVAEHEYTVIARASSAFDHGSQVEPEGNIAPLPALSAFSKGNSISTSTQIIHLPPSPSRISTTIQGHDVCVLPNQLITVDGITVRPGAPPTVISGQPIFLDSISQIYVGQHAYRLPVVTPITLPNGAFATPFPSGVFIDGTSLVAGAQPVMISGTVMSLDASNNLIIGTTARAPSSTPLPSNDRELSSFDANGELEVLSKTSEVEATSGSPEISATIASGLGKSLTTNAAEATDTLPSNSPQVTAATRTTANAKKSVAAKEGRSSKQFYGMLLTIMLSIYYIQHNA